MDHPIYKKAEKSEAEAEAWVFSSATTFEKYYYKLPKLLSTEVLIRVTSSGICQSDPHFGRGHFGPCLYPTACGHEISGEVIKLGSSTSKFSIGDRVMVGPMRNSCKNCKLCKNGKDKSCLEIDLSEKLTYGKFFGGFATHLHIDEAHAYFTPKNLDTIKMAPIMCAGMTTFTPLKKHAKKGDRVAVVGFGGLGHFAVQWASKMGCKVDVFSSSNSKEALVKKLGGDQIVIWTKNEHTKLQNAYDIVVNTLPFELSAEQLKGLVDVVVPEGVFVQLGVGEVTDKLDFNVISVISKSLVIEASAIGSRKDYQEMFDFAEEHGIECMSEIFQWEEFPKALDRLENGKPLFRVVVDVDPVSKKYKQFIQKIC